jgi:hypothetical protein
MLLPGLVVASEIVSKVLNRPTPRCAGPGGVAVASARLRVRGPGHERDRCEPGTVIMIIRQVAGWAVLASRTELCNRLR